MQGHMNVKFLELIFLKQIVIDYNRTAGKIKRSIAFTFLRLNLYFVLNSHFYRSVIWGQEIETSLVFTSNLNYT